MDIKLLVIRTSNMEQLADFYSLLGFTFEYHKHGNSPMHYSAIIGQAVLEIYPLAKGQEAADKHLRMGFRIDEFDSVMNRLRALSIQILQEPIETDFGCIAVVVDPDGRKIELYK